MFKVKIWGKVSPLPMFPREVDIDINGPDLRDCLSVAMHELCKKIQRAGPIVDGGFYSVADLNLGVETWDE